MSDEQEATLLIGDEQGNLFAIPLDRLEEFQVDDDAVAAIKEAQEVADDEDEVSGFNYNQGWMSGFNFNSFFSGGWLIGKVKGRPGGFTPQASSAALRAARPRITASGDGIL